MPSSTAKKVLANNPAKQIKFDELMKTEFDPSMSLEANTSNILRMLREDDMGPKSIPGKSVGGEVEIKKGSDYIKDLL
jgi:hypothetical protein|tara:strand:+ start:319 stop:552 length:234 start_codon:yes stop_codon:yes gene_type:complete